MGTGDVQRAGFILAVLLATLGGCSRTDVPSTGAGGAKEPSANAPVSSIVISIEKTGAELARVQNIDSVVPLFYLSPPDTEAPMIFAAIKKEDALGVPLIARKIGPTWRIAEISQAKQEWVYAAACPSRHEIWGILDQSDDAKAWELTLVRSTDGGLNWTFYAAVKKPSNSAVYAGFALAQNGIGRLSMHLEEDADNHPHGYYHYHTTNGGLTWTGPEHEGNDVAEADPLDATDKMPDAIKAAEAIPPQ